MSSYATGSPPPSPDSGCPPRELTAEARLGQDERESVVIGFAEALEGEPPYAHPQLARAMRDIRRKP
ncbi:hypothetical protein [Streptomyces sp. NPDC050535]|uniref:hypothetical protein n=1 Tax=Streptomyces sp. NPDC050535 TaxID=3365626 RepID=UPI0037A05C02